MQQTKMPKTFPSAKHVFGCSIAAAVLVTFGCSKMDVSPEFAFISAVLDLFWQTSPELAAGIALCMIRSDRLDVQRTVRQHFQQYSLLLSFVIVHVPRC